MILSETATAKIKQNFTGHTGMSKVVRSVSPGGQPVKLSKKEKETNEILSQVLLLLFRLYEGKLNETINKVREGKLGESEILPLLNKFRFALKKNTSVLVDDIWDNYKYYAAQKKELEEKDPMEATLNSKQTPQAQKQGPPEPEPIPKLQARTVSPDELVVSESTPLKQTRLSCILAETSIKAAASRGAMADQIAQSPFIHKGDQAGSAKPQGSCTQRQDLIGSKRKSANHQANAQLLPRSRNHENRQGSGHRSTGALRPPNSGRDVVKTRGNYTQTSINSAGQREILDGQKQQQHPKAPVGNEKSQKVQSLIKSDPQAQIFQFEDAKLNKEPCNNKQGLEKIESVTATADEEEIDQISTIKNTRQCSPDNKEKSNQNASKSSIKDKQNPPSLVQRLNQLQQNLPKTSPALTRNLTKNKSKSSLNEGSGLSLARTASTPQGSFVASNYLSCRQSNVQTAAHSRTPSNLNPSEKQSDYHYYMYSKSLKEKYYLRQQSSSHSSRLLNGNTQAKTANRPSTTSPYLSMAAEQKAHSIESSSSMLDQQEVKPNHNFRGSSLSMAEKAYASAGSVVEVFLNDPADCQASPGPNEETIYREDQPSMSPQKLIYPSVAPQAAIEKQSDHNEISKEMEESMERMAAEKMRYEKNFNSWSVQQLLEESSMQTSAPKVVERLNQVQLAHEILTLGMGSSPEESPDKARTPSLTPKPEALIRIEVPQNDTSFPANYDGLSNTSCSQLSHQIVKPMLSAKPVVEPSKTPKQEAAKLPKHTVTPRETQKEKARPAWCTSMRTLNQDKSTSRYKDLSPIRQNTKAPLTKKKVALKTKQTQQNHVISSSKKH